MSAKKVLEAALRVLDHGNRWTIGSAARDRYGEPIESPTSLRAKSWCAIGAVEKGSQIENATIEQTRQAHYTLFNAVENDWSQEGSLRWSSVAAFNDDKSTTYEDIALLFKRAIHSLDD
jgi:hypothetical protein